MRGREMSMRSGRFIITGPRWRARCESACVSLGGRPSWWPLSTSSTSTKSTHVSITLKGESKSEKQPNRTTHGTTISTSSCI
jgi:hypothetical protein